MSLIKAVLNKVLGVFTGGIFLLLSLLIQSCGVGEGELEHIAYQPKAVKAPQPEGFVPMAIPADNPLTEEGIALGRRLFYDPILSADSSVSCASCHHPGLGFAEARPFSVGVQGREGSRNAPSLVNIGFVYTGLFWDGRAPTLEEQALHPVTNPDEMGADWARIEARLQRHPDYPAHFRRAFGITEPDQINRDLLAKALAQFQRTLVSADARFDRVQRGEAAFTPEERRGWEIFFDFPGGLSMAECGHCHTDPLFTNLEYFNNGLDPAAKLKDLPDPGRGAVSGRRSDLGKFRTPSLRNIELTAPYMHDGRFASLELVIDHYDQGGHQAENVNPNVRPLHLSDRDKSDLIAFLRTLTDTSFVNNSKFQNPFHPE